MRKSTVMAALFGIVLFMAGLGYASAEGAKVYVALYRTMKVAVVDPVTLETWGTIETGAGPSYLRASKDGALVFVTLQNTDKVQVIDTKLDKTVAAIEVGSRPFGMDITPDGRQLIVCNMDDSSVSVIDVQRLKEIGRIKTSRQPMDVRVSPDSKTAYIAHKQPILEVIDLPGMKVVKSVGAPEEVHSMDISPSGKHLYLYGLQDEEITVMDTGKLKAVGKIKAGAMLGLKVSPDGNELWFASPDAKLTVHSLKLDKTLAELARVSGMTSCYIAFSPDGKTALAGPAGVDNNKVFVFDAVTKARKGEVEFPDSPRGLLFIER